MDDIDRRILDILQRDAKISQARIAETVGLTTPSVNERIKKLETRGFIRRFTALLDPRLVGIPLVAHVDVLLEHPRFERPFLEEIEALLDVQECYAISGDFGYRLKIRARDVEHLETILRQVGFRRAFALPPGLPPVVRCSAPGLRGWRQSCWARRCPIR